MGHGWRRIEARHIRAMDVTNTYDGLIWCRGKERNEWTPVLTETYALLLELTPDTLADGQPVLRSRRIRRGGTQPLG